MVWFFVRDRERVQMDTLFDNTTSEFVVRLFYPDGSLVVERFSTLAEFRDGIQHIEQRLTVSRWKQDGGPIFIPDGFPKCRSG